MLNKNQKKRLIIVSIIPLILLGIWCAEIGHKKFFKSNYFAQCTKSGNCVSHETEEPAYYETMYSGIFLGNPFGGTALEGGINEPIILATTNTEKLLTIPSKRSGRDFGCFIQYSKQFDTLETVNEVAKVTSSLFDTFNLDCGPYSPKDRFRFKNKDVHDGIVAAIYKDQELRGEFYDRQKRRSIAAFFAPFVVFFGSWFLLSLMSSVLRFIRYGRNPA